MEQEIEIKIDRNSSGLREVYRKRVWERHEKKDRGNEAINEKERECVGEVSKKRCMDTVSSDDFVNEYKMIWFFINHKR